MPSLALRPMVAGDLESVEKLLDAQLGGRHQARLGEVVDVLAGEGFVATHAGSLVGLVSWDGLVPRAEVMALAVVVSDRGHGLGGRLVDAVVDAATTRGCQSLWLVTTNDNLDALRLYQRHGFRLTELHAGAVDEARRRLKPGIPLTGAHGIPMRDELVLARDLA